MNDSSNKPREFDIHQSTAPLLENRIIPEEHKQYFIHAVEHSALVEAQAKIRELEDDAHTYKREWENCVERERYRTEERDQLRAQLTEALEVLESLYSRHLWNPVAGECICNAHADAAAFLAKHKESK